MTVEKLRELLDACFVAKRITEAMPALPQGMKPRHIHVIDAVYQLERSGGQVRVGDISKRLGITMPSVTKLINEMAAMGAVQKSEAGDDKRFTLLSLTEKGLLYEKEYVIEYHSAWSAQTGDISDAQADAAIQAITSLHKSMPKGDLTDE